MFRPQPLLRLVTGPVLGLSLSLSTVVAETLSPAAQHGDGMSPAIRVILSANRTVTDEPIGYPSGASAVITALEITLEPGEQTGWHTHPVPLFGYILEGELTVDYGAKGQRAYRQGDAIAEAMNDAHNGHNLGLKPVKILAVFVGVEGVDGSAAASAPAR
jgi:quercetin dioxygenase-like cupin family protein